MNPEECGVEIRKVTKTDSGDIRLQLKEKSQGAKSTFMATLSEKTGTTIKEQEKVMKLIVKGRGLTTTKDEVENAIKATITSTENIFIKVEEPKDNKFGSWSCRLTANEDLGRALLRAGKVQLGWFRGRIEQWTSVPCCQNCQKLGHITRECTEDKIEGKRCHKCGAVGHIARVCKEATSRCYNCNTEGHSAFSSDCPEYKKGFAKMRQNKKPTTSHNEERDHMDSSWTDAEKSSPEYSNKYETEDPADKS